MAHSVTLRQRTMASGNTQLYLDINFAGKRRTEGLGLTLSPSNTKAKNKEILDIAQQIAINRQRELIELENGIEPSINPNIRVIDYFHKCEARHSRKSKYNLDNMIRHIANYGRTKDMTFSECNEDWVIGLKNYLMNDAKPFKASSKECICKNYACMIYGYAKACFDIAIADGIIRRSPFVNIRSIGKEETETRYLTKDELKKIAECPLTHDRYNIDRNTYLFCCYVGMRFSDAAKLKWGDVIESNGRIRITFKQKKTGGWEYLDISNSAYKLMGERKADDVVVFDTNYKRARRTIIKLAKLAGIQSFTFHSSRHTCATMLLTKGADLYVTSKILGHTNIRMTQHYAKIIDAKKQEALDLLDDMI